jgi:hypothetical protein
LQCTYIDENSGLPNDANYRSIADPHTSYTDDKKSDLDTTFHGMARIKDMLVVPCSAELLGAFFD